MMLPLMDPVDGSTACAPTHGSHDVLHQLWISFVSLLRSHLGALQTTGRLSQAQFVALSDFEIEIVDLTRTVHISLQPANGDGEWSLTRVGEMIAAGSWVLHADATASIDHRAACDMEIAVEDFVDKLSTRGVAAPAASHKEELAR